MTVETTTQTSSPSSARPAARLGEVQAWLSERCDLQNGLRSSVAILHDDYRRWCRNRQESPLPSSWFRHALRIRGLRPGRDSEGKVFYGIEPKGGTPS